MGPLSAEILSMAVHAIRVFGIDEASIFFPCLSHSFAIAEASLLVGKISSFFSGVISAAPSKATANCPLRYTTVVFLKAFFRVTYQLDRFSNAQSDSL